MRNRILAILLGTLPILILYLLSMIPQKYIIKIITILGWIIIPIILFGLLYLLGFLILMTYYTMCDKEYEVDKLIEDIFFWTI